MSKIRLKKYEYTHTNTHTQPLASTAGCEQNWCPVYRVPIPLGAPSLSPEQRTETAEGSKPPRIRQEEEDARREEAMRGAEGVGVGRLLEEYLTGSWEDCKLI